MVIAAISLSLGLSCDRGTYESEPDPPCEPFIKDKDYEGPTRMLMGIGRGSIIAAKLRGQFPDRFGALATLGGPISLAGLIAQIEGWLLDFDNWSDEVSRTERLLFIEELFRAFGNPLYFNNDSDLYPPGSTEDDFNDPGNFVPKTISGFIDTLNPDGSLPVVTFADKSGRPVPFALALDQNQNGVRDMGEPIIIQSSETFNDTNENGIRDAGEAYKDFGLDGTPYTFDYGESNAKFDYSPAAAEFFDSDLFETTADADTEDNRNFVGSFFSDIGVNNPWQFGTANQVLFDRLPDKVTYEQDNHCIIDKLEIYTDYFWKEFFPLNKPLIQERFVWLKAPGSNDSELDPTDTNTEGPRARRMMQALNFLSARTLFGYLYEHKTNGKVVFKNHSFTSTTGYKIKYSVGLPEGYSHKKYLWRTYPMMYIFPDKGSDPVDFSDLLTYQGWLTDQQYSQQIILVVVDPDGENFGLEGYSYFTGPADQKEDQVNAEELFEEIITHVEERFRGNLE